MRFSSFAFCSILVTATCAQAQTQTVQQFTDPILLLQAVAKTYAAPVDTFQVEAIEETVRENEYLHERRTVYRTAIKGPGKQYRIETHSGDGSYIQVSDGETEWISSIEGKSFVKEPVPENWPTMPRIVSAGSMELSSAWRMRAYLKAEASNFKRASFLPEETIQIEDHTFSCYVVHAFSGDSDGAAPTRPYSEFTFWIDKKALVFRKQVQQLHGYAINSDHHIHIPVDDQITTVYPVMDVQPKLNSALFHFSPPADSTIAGFVGKQAPDVRFLSKDGSGVSLKSYEGKPVLIDFWATWCAPCIQAMPALARLYADAKEKGLVLLSVDEDMAAESAARYFEQHHYNWTNYHDDGTIGKAFWEEGLPFTILIDAKGKVTYYGFGGNDLALRSAIAALGPEFSSVKMAAGQ
ncbi:TlpA family protein disulfide reductase [Edaphobacter modestus]|uniref:Thiol-disulfide isomerase/thioredoxin n=1 Tax=Edaphobacter modestus TaxID=388466 RepID=A0A4V2G4W9_9BACT|nr:TlpA disulfide reductase family protein [Edaphobacter modestus]RZU42626.1 thiol-disulfide isomerase/thioredoxin [Edaphobacter modestus]